MSEGFTLYYWITAGLTFYWGLHTPTRLSPSENLYAMSVLCLFGFVLWPLFLLAFLVRPPR